MVKIETSVNRCCGTIDTTAYGVNCPGFQYQGGFLPLHASSPACNRFLKVSFGATPADCLEASMVVRHLYPCTNVEALVGLEFMIKPARCLTACEKTDLRLQ